MRRVYLIAMAGLVVMAGCSTKSTPSAQNSSSPPAATQTGKPGTGVTASTIKLGISYVDLAAIRNIVNIDQGDYQTAYRAVIDQVNSQGGINGRKIVPVFAPVNPIGTAPAAAACTQLTEDAKVFAVVGFFRNDDPLCYVKTHDTPIIGVSLTAPQQQIAKAPAFDVTLAPQHLIPKGLDAMDKHGTFSGRKVAVVGNTADAPIMNSLVLPELKRLGVNVVQTAVSDAAVTDTAAVYRQYGLISQKFQAVGANVVVAVGGGGATWLQAAQANHDTYRPALAFTDANQVVTYTTQKGYNPDLVSNVVASSGNAPPEAAWNDPAMKTCVSTIEAAHPSEPINNPITATANTKSTWTSAYAACQYVALFEAIAKAAGPTLNNASFLSAGESLKNVRIPAIPTPLNYSPDYHDGNGPVYLYRWDDSKGQLVVVS